MHPQTRTQSPQPATSLPKTAGIVKALRCLAVLLAGFLVLVPGADQTALAQSGGPWFARQGLALQGYDPVAYHQQRKPVRGSRAITYEWDGAVWAFASEEAKALFQANPQKFAPEFGGWCAFGAAKGVASPTDPTAFGVVDGKLYMNYSPAVHSLWKGNQEQFISRGRRNWPDVVATLPGQR